MKRSEKMRFIFVLTVKWGWRFLWNSSSIPNLCSKSRLKNLNQSKRRRWSKHLRALSWREWAFYKTKLLWFARMLNKSGNIKTAAMPPSGPSPSKARSSNTQLPTNRKKCKTTSVKISSIIWANGKCLGNGSKSSWIVTASSEKSRW